MASLRMVLLYELQLVQTASLFQPHANSSPYLKSIPYHRGQQKGLCNCTRVHVQ